MTVVYCTSRSSDLDRLKPSSWLIIRLQRDFLPRPLISSRDEAEAGKQKVTSLCTERRQKGNMQLTFHSLSSFQGLLLGKFIMQLVVTACCEANYLKAQVLTGTVPPAADQ